MAGVSSGSDISLDLVDLEGAVDDNSESREAEALDSSELGIFWSQLLFGQDVEVGAEFEVGEGVTETNPRFNGVEEVFGRSLSSSSSGHN
jgi:hypothetical protein